MGGEPLGGACEQRQQSATRRIWPAASTRKVSRDSRPPQCGLHQTHITLRRPQKDSDAIEGNAFLGLGEDATRNLDRFSLFSRGGEEDDFIVRLPLRRSCLREKIKAQPRETRIPGYDRCSIFLNAGNHL